MSQGDSRTFAIIGAALEVHQQLGCGFSEPVYQEAMAIELSLREIPFEPQLKLPIRYKGRVLEAYYRPDFFCFGDIMVEIKALAALSTIEDAQILNYLKTSAASIGLLINFGTTNLQQKRFIRHASWTDRSLDKSVDQSP